MSISYSTHVLLGYLSEIYFDKFRFYGVFLLSSKEKTYIFEVEYNNISVLPFIQDCIFFLVKIIVFTTFVVPHVLKRALLPATG